MKFCGCDFGFQNCFFTALFTRCLYTKIFESPGTFQTHTSPQLWFRGGNPLTFKLYSVREKFGVIVKRIISYNTTKKVVS